MRPMPAASSVAIEHLPDTTGASAAGTASLRRAGFGLASKDFANFHRQALEALANFGGINIVVLDPTGQQVINTSTPFGAPLPRPEMEHSVVEVFQTARPMVTDLFVGSQDSQPTVGIVVPIIDKGTVTYVLGMGASPEHLAEILYRAKLPETWISGIVDTTGTFVSRTQNPKQFIGKKAAPELIHAIAKAPEGVIEGGTQDGISVVVGFSRSTVSGWTVGIAIPTAELMAPLYRSLWLPQRPIGNRTTTGRSPRRARKERSSSRAAGRRSEARDRPELGQGPSQYPARLYGRARHPDHLQDRPRAGKFAGMTIDRSGASAIRGFALILMIWVLALLALLGAEVAANSRSAAVVSRNRLDLAQLRASADAGVTLAVMGLLDPVVSARWQADGRVYDRRYADQRLAITVADEAGKIDLNTAPKEPIAGLLNEFGADRNQQALIPGDPRSPRAIRARNTGALGEYRTYFRSSACHQSREARAAWCEVANDDVGESAKGPSPVPLVERKKGRKERGTGPSSNAPELFRSPCRPCPRPAASREPPAGPQARRQPSLPS